MVTRRIHVIRKKITVMILILIMAVYFSGCTSQPGEKMSNQTPDSLKIKEEADNSDNQNSDSESHSSSPKISSGDSYFNIRIVPASVLDKLQKEMDSDEYLVKNDKGYVIGIVSSETLVLRGDLVQLQEQLGSSGKDFDKTDVSLHLLDITFGLDNSKISLFKSNKDYKFWFDAYYSDSEVQYVQQLARLLNSLSGTTQFEDEEVALGFLQTNYENIPFNYYNIKIVTDKMLKEFVDDRIDSDHLIKDNDGKIIGLVNIDYLFLVNTLDEEEQEYYILKGLLYSMGLHGTSYKNKESFFYREEGINKNLSDLDMEAIKLLYGGGLKNGNTLEDVRKTLGLTT
jgi:hypothetical protein